MAQDVATAGTRQELDTKFEEWITETNKHIQSATPGLESTQWLTTVQISMQEIFNNKAKELDK